MKRGRETKKGIREKTTVTQTDPQTDRKLKQYLAIKYSTRTKKYVSLFNNTAQASSQ